MRLYRRLTRPLLAFTLPFFVYLLTLAPTIYNLDSAELTTAAATGGLVRATGYPLYLLLGHAWSEIPIGDVGYRMNLFSALCGALTVMLAERILRRLGVGGWAALGALGLLATAPYYWALSLVAEVYTLHTLLMATTMLLVMRWGVRPSPVRLAPVALIVGLSLGHHAATVLLLPGILVYLLATAPRAALAPRAVAVAVGAGLLGLSVYLYLPLAYTSGPPFNYAGRYDGFGRFDPVDLTSARGLWWLVSGRAFAGQMLAYRGPELVIEIRAYLIQLVQAFFAFGIAPGLLGLGLLLRRRRAFAMMSALMFALTAAFYIDYRVVDKPTMFLPTYLIWTLWLGVGLEELLDWVRASEPRTLRRGGLVLLRGGIVLLALAALLWNWRLVDLSDDLSSRARGERILATVEPNALILGFWETTPLLEYLTLVEGRRPDVRPLNRFLISHPDMIALIEREVARRPVYIDGAIALPPTLQSRQEGALLRLLPRPAYTRGRAAPHAR